jgi:hypothetical protein
VRKLIIAGLLFGICAGLVLCERSAVAVPSAPAVPLDAAHIERLGAASRLCADGVEAACVWLQQAAGVDARVLR